MLPNAKVFVAYGDIMMRPSPFHGNPCLVNTFVEDLRIHCGIKCPNLDFFLDREINGLDESSRNQKLQECVALIAVVVNGNFNQVLIELLEKFCCKPEFLFDSPPWERIFLVGLERTEPIEFTVEARTYTGTIQHRLSIDSREAFATTAQRLAIEFATRLTQYHPKGRIVLGIPVPTDEYGFRDKIKKEIVNTLGYEVVDVRHETDTTPECTREKLTRAMDGAAAVLHFVAEPLTTGWVDVQEYALDVQIDVAHEFKALEVFCAGPGYRRPQKTRSKRHALQISKTKTFIGVKEFCQHLQERLNGEPEMQPHSAGITICLVGEKDDENNLLKIERYLRENDLEVARPVPGADEIFDHSRHLLLYWGSGRMDWYEDTLQGLVNAKLDGKKIPLDFASVYFAKLKDEDKIRAAGSGKIPVLSNLLKKYEPIEAWDDFSEEHLEPFIQAVKKG